MQKLDFTPAQSSIDYTELRQQVRRFLKPTLNAMTAAQRAHSWTGFDADFSQQLGEQGWLGMPWPKHYGGSESSALERYIVIEELLAAGAPVGAHWIADRQSGALLLRFADQAICQQYLPKIAAGKLFFCIGMSEPNAGSDLAAINTRAKKVDKGWLINGAKLWTTNVDKAHMMIALVRTGESEGNRHQGFSQFLIDLSSPGITINAITDQTGEQHFGEVFLDDVFVPDDHLIGTEGEGWQQVNAELALERSGPERYLSSYRLIEEFIGALKEAPPDDVVNGVGEMVANVWALRNMSLSVANQISNGKEPNLEACIVKDLGAKFEQGTPYKVQSMMDGTLKEQQRSSTESVVKYLLNAAPSFSLRGGTKEILRGIIARGLGLR